MNPNFRTGVNPNRSRTKMHNDLDPDSEAIDPEVDIKPLYPEFPGHKQHLNEESPKKQKNEEGDMWVEIYGHPCR